MTITASTTATVRTPMDPTRRAALLGGAFYLLTFVASIPALLLIDPVLHNPDYIVSAGSDTRVLWGCLLDVVNAFAGIGTAVALFPAIRRHGEASALGFVTTRTMEAATIMIGVVCLLAVVTLRQDAAGADQATLVTTGKALVEIRNWTFLLGPGLMPVLNGLLFASLLYRARLVPRIIPTIGLIGAPLLLASTMSTFFGLFGQVSTWATLLGLPIAVWEFSIGVYMLVKGFRPVPAAAKAGEA